MEGDFQVSSPSSALSIPLKGFILFRRELWGQEHRKLDFIMKIPWMEVLLESLNQAHPAVTS